MLTTFTFGESQTCEAALGDFTRLAAATAHPPLENPAGAVRAALENPLDFPPLSAAIVPGDRIAIAIADGVPNVERILDGAVMALLGSGADPQLIAIVSQSAIAARERLEHRLAEIGAGGVQFEVHDPDDEKHIAMVGVTTGGLPLRMNRTIAEADFVLPIGASQPGDSVTKRAKFADLYPAFADQDTISRLRPRGVRESDKQRDKRIAEVDDALWKLGVGLVVSIVPSVQGAAEVLAGDPAQVAAASRGRVGEIWHRPALAAGDLVIAAIAGGEHEQTWSNLARALHAAAPVLQDGGAIVVCSELAEPPSGPLELLREAVDFEEVQRELAREADADVEPAMALAHALERGPVYLRSRLPPDVVESLGMTPIENDAELSRLAVGRDHCVLIEEAQRVVPQLLERTHRDPK